MHWLILVLTHVLVSLGGASAVAADYTPALTQYAHASWRVQDGDIDGASNGITQSRDGYLWVATQGGLKRYDGARFQPWRPLGDKSVASVLGARDGSIWAGGHGRLYHVKGEQITTLGPPGVYNALLEDRAGSVWAVRTRAPDGRGGLCEVQGGSVRCFGASDHQDCGHGQALARDLKGDFWIGSDSGLCVWRPGSGHVFKGDAAYRNLSGVAAALSEADGSVLIGFSRGGPHLGLERFTASGPEPVDAKGFTGESAAVQAILRDRKGALWIGTANDGVYHIVNGVADHFTIADGLSGSGVNAFHEDREGNVWVATSGGVDRFYARSVIAISTREGLSSDDVASVLASRDGSVWMGAGTGLSVLAKGVISTLRARDGLPGSAVTSLFQDHADQMWVGVDNDLAVYSAHAFHIVHALDGGKLGVIAGIVEDQAHDVWVLVVGKPFRLYRIRKGKVFDEVRLLQGATPHAIATDPSGAVWIVDSRWNLQIFRHGQFEIVQGIGGNTGAPRGFWVGSEDTAFLATGEGLYNLKGGQWALLDASQGLPCNAVDAVVDDGHGSLWVRTECGLAIIAKSDFDRWRAHPQSRLAVRTLDAVDGARPGLASFAPDATSSLDGRVWFATDGVVLTAYAAHLASNVVPPPVAIEQIVADHRVLPRRNSTILPPLTRDVEIDYTGLSFVAPQKVRFRYRLSGVDKNWQDVSTRRSAFYMNLPPGKYVFQVLASNNDGVWNTQGDTIKFAIQPTFYQTFWFQALLALLVVGLVSMGVRLRVQYLTAQIESRLLDRQAERVRIARELHDTLLQGFHGLLARLQVVANAIPSESSAKPMMYSVLDRADEILVEGRDRVLDLRSEEEGRSPLVAELERIGYDLERQGSVAIDVGSVGEPRPLVSDVQREILAIVQEALTNAARHSKASHISCKVVFMPRRLTILCEDNGIGVDSETLRIGAPKGHWGLMGMRERTREVGGALHIRSSDAGTSVAFALDGRLAYVKRKDKPIWLPWRRPR